MLQVDPGREFMGAVTKEMEKHKTYIRRGRAEIHRDQAIVERFNRTLAERLFKHQYAVEMRLPDGQRSTAWVGRVPKVVSALNNEVTSLIDIKPAVAIKERAVYSKPSTPYFRAVGEKEKLRPSLVQVRYLYQPGELEGGTKRATDPIWSLNVCSIERSFTKPEQPVLYYCATAPSAVSFVKSCWLSLQTHNYHPSKFKSSASISSISLYFYVNALPQVFHGFTENRVVHELVKVLFKFPLRFFLNSVFIRMYGSIQHSCSNSNTLCTRFSFMPCFR